MNLDATPFAPLATHLIDLLQVLDGSGVNVTLVGGFGLALRRMHAEQQELQTLIRRVPVARATKDFDLLLDLEALRDHHKMAYLRRALDGLGYEEIGTARYYQFIKPGSGSEATGHIKVDLLASQPEDPENYKIKDRRISSKAPEQTRRIKLHAHLTPEALGADEHPTLIPLQATGSDGNPRAGLVRLPHTYTLYCMKLHAFRDEHEGKKADRGDRREYALKHAGDLYTLTTLLTAAEFDQLALFKAQYAHRAAAQDAARIVAQYFCDERAPGSLAVRRQYNPNAADLQTFLSVLQRHFPLLP